MAAEAVMEALKQQSTGDIENKYRMPIEQAAIIGAAGNIGSVFSSLVAEYCPSLLVGSREGLQND